jgi:hypothetical protein
MSKSRRTVVANTKPVARPAQTTAEMFAELQALLAENKELKAAPRRRIVVREPAPPAMERRAPNAKGKAVSNVSVLPAPKGKGKAAPAPAPAPVKAAPRPVVVQEAAAPTTPADEIPTIEPGDILYLLRSYMTDLGMRKEAATHVATGIRDKESEALVVIATAITVALKKHSR